MRPPSSPLKKSLTQGRYQVMLLFMLRILSTVHGLFLWLSSPASTTQPLCTPIMKPKTILAMFIVALSTFAHSAMAGFTYDKNGEVTHCNGVPLPPIQTAEQARVETEKHLAAIKAEENRQAELAPNTHPTAETVSPREVFSSASPTSKRSGNTCFFSGVMTQNLAAGPPPIRVGFRMGRITGDMFQIALL